MGWKYCYPLALLRQFARTKDKVFMWKVVSTLKQNLVWSIPAFMIAGLIVGALVNPAPLKALIIPLTFLMVYPMMINLQVQKVLSGGDFKVQLATQLINFAIVPFFAYGLGYIFF